jgi:hypothetical protein
MKQMKANDGNNPFDPLIRRFIVNFWTLGSNESSENLSMNFGLALISREGFD